MASNSSYAIETEHLSKRYRRQVVFNTADHRRQMALQDLTLRAPRGSVFAFLGKNGAGKTTTIRILLDLLDRTSGLANVLGLDCVRDALQIKQRVGYVAEGQRMYDWMKVDEIIWFCKGFYPDWSDQFAEELKKRLELPGDKRIRELSRGTQAKVALLLAMAYRPELLILDEPTAGLDVLVRRDFVEGVIELIQQEGRTVFFSSHLVHEVERVADWVGIIDEGLMIWCSPVQELKNSVKRIVLTFDEPPVPMEFERRWTNNLLRIEHFGKQSTVTVKKFSDQTVALAQSMRPKGIEVEDLSLEDIFVAMVGHPEEAYR